MLPSPYRRSVPDPLVRGIVPRQAAQHHPQILTSGDATPERERERERQSVARRDPPARDGSRTPQC
jgi:hypothetical protein